MKFNVASTHMCEDEHVEEEIGKVADIKKLAGRTKLLEKGPAQFFQTKDEAEASCLAVRVCWPT